jgi:hypothetical protein
MITLLINTYRRLDLLQRQRWFCIAASVIALAACAGYFGTLAVKGASIAEHRELLRRVLTEQTSYDVDTVAESLLETGTVTIEGQVYGSNRLKDRVGMYISESGQIGAPGPLVEAMLAPLTPTWAPDFLIERSQSTLVLGSVALAAFLLIIWLYATVPFLLTAAGTGVVAMVMYALGREGLMVSLIGVGLLTFMFVILTRAALVALGSQRQPTAIAHTLVREASRQGLSLVFIVVLLVLLPMLPLALDPNEALRYRIQTFMDRSLSLTFALAACLTLFLSVGTVAFEIRDKQIWQLMTKPVNRMQYLLGKWLGIAVINLLLLLICGVSIFYFVQYLRMQPVAPGLEGAVDRLAVRDEVLVARKAARIDLTNRQLSREQIEARVDQRLERDPSLAGPDAEVTPSLRRSLAQQILKEHERGELSIPGRTEKEYIFSGLDEAISEQSTLTMRYRFFIGESSTHEVFPVMFMFNDREDMIAREDFVPTMSHTLPVPANLIREDGTLKVTIYNPYMTPDGSEAPSTINFDYEDFEILYKVGNFEGNFLRAILVMWLKLAFLGLLGIVCATFLSFPVACLLAFTVFVVWLLGPFVAEALEAFYPPPLREVDWSSPSQAVAWAVTVVLRMIASALVFVSGQIGEYKPTEALVQGRFISWASVLGGIGRLIIVWCGALLLMGFLVFRRRELATYSGQG